MTIDALRSTVSGRILLDGDDDFAAAPYPAGPPTVVVQAAHEQDVLAAVRYARDTALALSVRSGGHSAGTWSTHSGGLDLDLSAMNDIAVDGATVRIGPGATWGSVAEALAQHGLALSSGDTRSVGVGGLTLGGGVGWLVRQYGLALDSLLSARVVTADAGLVTASASENPDLFWAIRGGGGNFGVVVEFTFEAHPLTGVVHGVISFADTDLGTILRGYRDAMRRAPEELNVTFMQWPGFGPDQLGGPQLHVLYASTDESAAQQAIAPLLAIPGVASHDIQPKAYADVLEELPAPEPGAPMPVIVGNNGFAHDLSDSAITAVVDAMDAAGQGGVLMLRYLRGAFNRPGADSTAFAWRDAEALIMLVAFLPPDADPVVVEAAENAWGPLDAHTSGTYGNFLGYAGERAVARMYPPATRARLAAVKHHWDPTNLFSQNQNIEPVAGVA